MNSTFLICGYPRSRSMWLSHFLTIPGETVCAHEATEYAGSAEEFWDNADRLAKTFSADIYGNADSANIFVLPALLAARPLTRVVWIERSITEVEESMRKAGMPTHGLSPIWILRSRYMDHFDLTIAFHELTNPSVCKQLWDFCLPGIDFDFQRWCKFHSQKIGYSKENPMPQKNFQKFLNWAQREINESERIIN